MFPTASSCVDTRIASLHPVMISCHLMGWEVAAGARHLGGANDVTGRQQMQEVGRRLISSGWGRGVGSGDSRPASH